MPVEMQPRSTNNSEFAGFIIFKLAMKIHSEKEEKGKRQIKDRDGNS